MSMREKGEQQAILPTSKAAIRDGSAYQNVKILQNFLFFL